MIPGHSALRQELPEAGSFQDVSGIASISWTNLLDRCRKVPKRRGEAVLVMTDEGIWGDTSAEVLGALESSFSSGGTVTAGNASPLNDGATAVILTTRGHARPRAFRFSPPPCIGQGWTVADLDFVENYGSLRLYGPALGRGQVNIDGEPIASGPSNLPLQAMAICDPLPTIRLP